MSPFAAQLSRHPALQQVPMDAMYARHPAQVDADGRRRVPAVHRGPLGVSLFIHPYGRRPHRLLADAIEYHPDHPGQLRELLGQEITLYAQVARRDARQARVRVEPGAAEGAFLLRLVTTPPAEPPGRVMWADME